MAKQERRETATYYYQCPGGPNHYIQGQKDPPHIYPVDLLAFMKPPLKDTCTIHGRITSLIVGETP